MAKSRIKSSVKSYVSWMITSDLMYGIFLLSVISIWVGISTSATNKNFEINLILNQKPVKQLQKSVFLHTLLRGSFVVTL